MDFHKAFDTVPRMQRLQEIGEYALGYILRDSGGLSIRHDEQRRHAMVSNSIDQGGGVGASLLPGELIPMLMTLCSYQIHLRVFATSSLLQGQ